MIRCDMPIMLAASILFSLFLTTGGGLVRWEGAVLVAGIIAFTIWSVAVEKRETTPLSSGKDSVTVFPAAGNLRLWLSILLVAAGLGLLVLGARLLVDNAVIIARDLGISEAVIGLTIVAAETSSVPTSSTCSASPEPPP